MSETIRLILTKFTDETIVIFSLLLLVTMLGIIVYWFYNRKKFHQLSHEIPASVVKNYLDSIIQNSNSLKSSLFRGGGLDMGNGIPSVVPIGDLPTSKIHGMSEGEESSQKNAEIASLTQKLSDRQKQITDLEKTIQDLSSNRGLGAESDMLKKDLIQANHKIKELEDKLRGAQTLPTDAGLSSELKAITAERDELAEKLKEYAIIEEDLANLKRLQQENEQLKAEVADFKNLVGTSHKEEIETKVAAVEEELEDFEDLEAAMARAIAGDDVIEEELNPEANQVEVKGTATAKDDGESKSAEELLSEFEKMLG